MRQYFTPEELEKEFKACGFTIDSYYADVAGVPFSSPSKEFTIIAKSYKANPADGLQPRLIRDFRNTDFL